LRVILDKKLKFSEHITSVEKKSVGILGKLKHYLTKKNSFKFTLFFNSVTLYIWQHCVGKYITHAFI